MKWLKSGHHEMSSLSDVSLNVFGDLAIEDTCPWILSSATAADVGLGSTFSPAHWNVVPNPKRC